MIAGFLSSVFDYDNLYVYLATEVWKFLHNNRTFVIIIFWIIKNIITMIIIIQPECLCSTLVGIEHFFFTT